MAPDPVGEWTDCMRRGDFAGAWRIADVLQQHASIDRRTPRHQQAVWDGTPLDDRRILVRCYHGLGDTIQFIRYAPYVRRRASELLVWAQPPLLPLLARVPGIDRLLPLHDGEVDASYDVDIEVMELPHAFRTEAHTIPAAAPYLHVEPLTLSRTSGPAVGLVWRAGDWAEHRSLPFGLLAPLVSAPVTWYVLQGRPGLSERPDGFGICAGTDDLVEAARAIRALDLLITIDSMPAHLGGALGTPVWTLLSADADWRWMQDRDDSPWYPSMRLFRQGRAGEWPPVVARVAAALHAWLADRTTAN